MTDTLSTDTLPTEDDLRTEVKDWLAKNWTGLPDSAYAENGYGARTPQIGNADYIAWLDKVLEAGYAVPTWPVGEYHGRGYPSELADVIAEEFAAAGAPGACQDKYSIPANTVMKFGTEKCKNDIIGPVLTGRIQTCLFYSEPGAGSDLGGLTTTAVRDGDHWVVNGSKIWTSGAVTADYALMLARTDWDVPKHRGLSYFIVPMHQPGIEVNPIKQITGEAHFNQEFITDAIVPGEYLVGAEGDGWRVIQTALAYERSAMGEGSRASRHGTLAEDIIGLAREHECLDDRVVRNQMAGVLALRELNDLNNARAKAELGQGTNSPIMSLGKLAMAKILHAEGALRTEIIGADSLLWGDENPEADDVNYLMLTAFITSIGGGSNQIQRGIIGERVLGLPKEPRIDASMPFRDVPRG